MYERIESLLASLNGKNYDIEKIKEAYLYAEKMHEGQFRLSGDPYITHPVEVANIVASLGIDTDAICAAFLHDTIEDCSEKTNLKEIEQRFGADVAELVDGLTKIKPMDIEDKELTHIENLRKMLLAMAKDIRVIIIKLCDRLHNLRTLSAKDESRQRAIALETMHVYAPIADRLGMQFIKQELENLSLSYLDPIGYKEVQNAVDLRYGQGREYIDEAKKAIDDRMKKENIHCEITGRVKSIGSLYRKIFRQNKSFDEIYDFYAIRVIVETEADCYMVLGLIHEMYKSVPGRFKDYISTPKSNMYRSLHTTVIGHSGIPFEVQIRTFEMHKIAEYGIAAHWKYKSGEKSSASIDKELSWISKLLENNAVSHDVDEVMSSFKVDLFHNETFVFTPKGDVVSIPFGSNTIDFAYAIHSAVGNKMLGAKVNGIMVPIDRVLVNGDVVEIITSSSVKGPSRDWLKIVTTSEARDKIRAWFKKEKRDDNIALGKIEIEKELKKYNRPYTEQHLSKILLNISSRLGFANAEDLYNAIGYGGLTISKIQSRLKDEFDRVVQVEEPPVTVEDPITLVNTTTNNRKNKKSSLGVVVDGQDGCLVKFAKCCNPLPGDNIVGFITKNFGISIHKDDCPNVLSYKNNPETASRLLSANWDFGDDKNQIKNQDFEVGLQIVASDTLGLLAEISQALVELKVQISKINSQKTQKGVIFNITVLCHNIEHYQIIVNRILKIQSVESVNRGFS